MERRPTKGSVGYLQVIASTFNNFEGKNEESSDNIVFSDLITFTDVAAAGPPTAQRIVSTGNVARYIRFSGDVTGPGRITLFCGFSRS